MLFSALMAIVVSRPSARANALITFIASNECSFAVKNRNCLDLRDLGLRRIERARLLQIEVLPANL